MTLHLNASVRSATVRINEELDAGGIDALICELASLRAEMQPEVSSTAPRISELAPATAQRLIFQVHGETDGRCQLRVRDAGTGWRAIDLSVVAVIALYEALRDSASNREMPTSTSADFDSDLQLQLEEEVDLP